jgi:hypothetical protein
MIKTKQHRGITIIHNLDYGILLIWVLMKMSKSVIFGDVFQHVHLLVISVVKVRQYYNTDIVRAETVIVAGRCTFC